MTISCPTVNLCKFFQEDGIADIQEMIRMDRPYLPRRIRAVLEELATACSKYLTLNQSKVNATTGGRTKLDKERIRFCQREIVSNDIVFYQNWLDKYIIQILAENHK